MLIVSINSLPLQLLHLPEVLHLVLLELLLFLLYFLFLYGCTPMLLGTCLQEVGSLAFLSRELHRPEDLFSYSLVYIHLVVTASGLLSFAGRPCSLPAGLAVST